jgi:hypothetical protein
MKTTNANQPRILKLITACILLSFSFSFSVVTCHAQQDINNGKSTLLTKVKTKSNMLLNPFTRISVDASNSFFENDIVLESWMTDLSYWNRLNEFPITDADLEFENWMTDITKWYDKEISLLNENLKLEEWMIDYKKWGINKTENIEEPDLELENWMTNLKEW